MKGWRECGRSKQDVRAPHIGHPARSVGIPAEVRVGVVDARVMFFLVRIGVRAVLWVADLPEIFDELLALVISGQGQESFAFLICGAI